MTSCTPDEERQGRMAFDGWRFDEGDRVSWDWADMSDTEKQHWIERAQGLQEMPPHRRR
jgi:hypothetical protein